MAAGVQKFTTQGPSADTGERQRLYNVTITQSSFNSTASSNNCLPFKVTPPGN